MIYTYLIDEIGKPTLRRFLGDAEKGERWVPGTGWVTHCAPRAACRLTSDREVTDVEAVQRFPGCLAGV